MDEKPQSRWSRRFGIRTLFLIVFLEVAALPLAWVSYSLYWISQRNAIRRRADVSVKGKLGWPPEGLWLFGETYANYVDVEEDSPLTTERLEDLFPEAIVHRVPKSVWQFNGTLKQDRQAP